MVWTPNSMHVKELSDHWSFINWVQPEITPSCQPLPVWNKQALSIYDLKTLKPPENTEYPFSGTQPGLLGGAARHRAENLDPGITETWVLTTVSSLFTVRSWVNCLPILSFSFPNYKMRENPLHRIFIRVMWESWFVHLRKHQQRKRDGEPFYRETECSVQ